MRRQKKLDADDQGEIWGILNQDGELIRLDEPIEVTPAIERWMHQLESSMKQAVSQQIHRCLRAFEKEEFKDWLSNWPTQFCLVSMDLLFSQRLMQVFPQAEVQRPVVTNMRRLQTNMKRTPNVKRDKEAEARALARALAAASSELKKLLASVY